MSYSYNVLRMGSGKNEVCCHGDGGSFELNVYWSDKRYVFWVNIGLLIAPGGLDSIVPDILEILGDCWASPKCLVALAEKCRPASEEDHKRMKDLLTAVRNSEKEREAADAGK